MYSAKVLEHLENPQNVGELIEPDARGESTNPVCGDRLSLTIRLADGVISEARFMVEGCPPSIAAGSVLTSLLCGLTPAEALGLTPRQVSTALDSLPRHKEHCAVLAIDAVRAALTGR
jgi:nitrogen fixation NifU-like protein